MLEESSARMAGHGTPQAFVCANTTKDIVIRQYIMAKEAIRTELHGARDVSLENIAPGA
jgi:hypothetical protein